MAKETDMKYFKKGFNYSQDGPGNRLIFHLQGCNMHCPWCSNPEGMDINSTKVQCINDEEVVNEAVRSKKMLFDGGGVTFTGGEATIQFESLLNVLKMLKGNEINTCIETNATHPKLKELFLYLDYLILDFKHYDEKKSKEVLGVSADIVKNNIKTIIKEQKKALIRTPLIHGFNDDIEDVTRFLEFYKDLDTSNLEFEFLPYHEYGKDKWKSLGKEYEIKDGYVLDAVVKKYEEAYEKQGLKVIHT